MLSTRFSHQARRLGRLLEALESRLLLSGTFSSNGDILPGQTAVVHYDTTTLANGYIPRFSYDFDNDGTYEINNSADSQVNVPAPYLTAEHPTTQVRVHVDNAAHGAWFNNVWDETTTISLLRNDLGFQTASDALATGRGLTNVVSADFNGDGRADLAVGQSDNQSIGLFLGQGGGKFAPRIDLGVGSAMNMIAAGDLNHDGKQDLVVAGKNTSHLRILWGNGGGGFLPALTLATANEVKGLSIADYNGDSIDDVAFWDDTGVWLLSGRSNGVFDSARQIWSLPANQQWSITGDSEYLVSADFNGDGRQDLAFSHSQVFVLLNSGSGAFQLQSTLGSYQSRVAVGDLNGDGKLDLAIQHYDEAQIHLGDGAGNFTPLGSPLTLAESVSAIQIADVNGDGAQDLLMTEISNSFVRIFPGNGHGAFYGPIDVTSLGGPVGLLTRDFNGDGYQDIVSINDEASRQVAGPSTPAPSIKILLTQRALTPALTLQSNSAQYYNGQTFEMTVDIGSMYANQEVNYRIDWGDGSAVETQQDSGVLHWPDHPYTLPKLTISRTVNIVVSAENSQTGWNAQSQLALRIDPAIAEYFSESFYLQTNPDVAAAVARGDFANGLEHFLKNGVFEKRSANLFFDEAYYLASNPDVAGAVSRGEFISGYEHFCLNGQSEDRNPSSFIDLNYYKDKYVSGSNSEYRSIFDRFLRYGQYHNENPNPLFDTRTYLRENPDVARQVAAGTIGSAFEHYARYGWKEGRTTSYFFDERYYLANNPDVAAAVQSGALKNGAEHLLRYGHDDTSRKVSPIFSGQTYVYGRSDQYSKTSLWSYLRSSTWQSTLPFFDANTYLIFNPDVAQAVKDGVFRNGFEHFLAVGRHEYRLVSPLFDETYYLSQNPDVAQAVANGIFASGMDHYLAWGMREGRPAAPPSNPILSLTGSPSAVNAQSYRLKIDFSGRTWGDNFYYTVYWGDGQPTTITSHSTHIETTHTYALDDNTLKTSWWENIFVTLSDGTVVYAYSDTPQWQASLKVEVMPAADSSLSLFDERFYLQQNPDVAAAIARGDFSSGYAHFIAIGAGEGRRPNAFFEPNDYRTLNPEVFRYFDNPIYTYTSGYDHFLREGQFYNLGFSPFFDRALYLAKYPDVAQALNNGTIPSVFAHFLRYGQYEGRSPLSQFNTQIYLAHNPDVAAAIAQGQFSSAFEHYVLYGYAEGRIAI